MAQQQPDRPPQHEELRSHEPIKYGDVFNISGELGEKPVAPRDAATVQASETTMMGKVQKGGPASVMQSAANFNVASGLLSPENATDAAKDIGVSFSQSEDRGNRVVTEWIGGQVVGQFVAPLAQAKYPEEDKAGADSVTIGEALEAAAISIGDKPVDRKDAAAIQTAETRVTGGKTPPGGVAATAQAAAVKNERTTVGKITIADVLTDATEKLPGDKAVTATDAEAVVGTELRNSPEMKTTAGGVADSMSAGARLNQQPDLPD